MSELRTYEVEINGWPTALRLSDADAEKRGLTDEDLAERRVAARKRLGDQAAGPEAQAEAKKATAANKARAAANKDGA